MIQNYFCCIVSIHSGAKLKVVKKKIVMPLYVFFSPTSITTENILKCYTINVPLKTTTPVTFLRAEKFQR